jgi:hypothetical protein
VQARGKQVKALCSSSIWCRCQNLDEEDSFSAARLTCPPPSLSGGRHRLDGRADGRTDGLNSLVNFDKIFN